MRQVSALCRQWREMEAAIRRLVANIKSCRWVLASQDVCIASFTTGNETKLKAKSV
jgi:hypothetical protein